jgi:D-glycero-beta-D-manno-heptose-7-phosphate kinase
VTDARLLPVPPERTLEIVSRFHGATVLVVGDVMLDRFLIGRVSRISPEAPVPIVQFEREEHRIGGAGNVAHNIAALGGQAILVGLAGQDEAAETLRRALEHEGVAADGLVVADGRRTTTKVRIVTDRHQQVARIDYEHDDEVTGGAADRLLALATARAADAGAILISDYLKGAVSRSLVAGLNDAANARRIPLLVDPKIPHLDYYAGATMVTPNHHEAEIAVHQRIRSDAEARIAARAFRDRARCQSVLVTRGEQGMWLLADDAEGALPATAREVADVTGAGDTVIATLALALAAGASTTEASQLANHAAGVVVGKFGPATLRGEELVAAATS